MLSVAEATVDATRRTLRLKVPAPRVDDEGMPGSGDTPDNMVGARIELNGRLWRVIRQEIADPPTTMKLTLEGGGVFWQTEVASDRFRKMEGPPPR